VWVFGLELVQRYSREFIRMHECGKIRQETCRNGEVSVGVKRDLSSRHVVKLVNRARNLC
jgi:hypothetical protein